MEAPHLTALYEKYQDQGFTVLAVNGYDESREVVQKFVDDKKLTHPIVLMGSKVAQGAYHVSGFPTGYWIDKNGNIVDREVGFGEGMEKQMAAKIEELLAK